MSYYRARPIVPEIVEARQFTSEADADEISEWCDGYAYRGTQHGHTRPPGQFHVCLNPEVIEGSKGHADPGDWIVKRGDDLCEILSPEEFAEKYEAAG